MTRALQDLPAARKANEAARARKWRDWRERGPGCEYCDDTGHVHSIDGEWRGICVCPAGAAISKAQGAPHE